MRKITGSRSDKRWFAIKEMAVFGKPMLQNAPTVPIHDGNLEFIFR
jgi:hypothetical protein